MLKSFFGSKTRVKLLGLFLLHQQNEYFIRELTRTLKEQINSVRRELDNLKKVGLLKTYSRNRKKYYKINTDFALLSELTDVFAKASNPTDEIAQAIGQFGTVDFLVLAGQFVGNAAGNVDLLIVGELDKEQLKQYLDGELSATHKVKYTVMTRADFLYRLDCKDKFVLDLLAAKEKLVPVNKLKKYIDARVKARA
jgi:predicted transcriptional regulator